MKQLEFTFDPEEISFSESKKRARKKEENRPFVSIRPRKDGGVGFGLYNLGRLSYSTGTFSQLTPGVFEKFGIRKLVFRVGSGYRLTSPNGQALWFHTKVKAEQYADFIGKDFLLNVDSSGEYIFGAEEVGK